LKTIGVAKKSKYNQYEATKESVFEKMLEYYETMKQISFEELNIPTSINQQQEKKYRELRESKIDFIEFINHAMEGKVYDFMIGNKKVQEKVGTIMHENPYSYLFKLAKNAGKIDGKCTSRCYEKGDCDFYWLHCKNGRFYVIPEYVLAEKGYIGTNTVKEKLYVSPTNYTTSWSNEYLFDYENVDKEKLLKILDINEI
jgi:hypothetical protein